MADDAKMMYIDDDIKKIQTKTNMFITQFGPAGAAHLCREILQNGIDELLDPKSYGRVCDVGFNLETDTMTCEDDGRGFPENDYPLDIFLTKNQSGSKFYREDGIPSSGEFGVGLTVVNALSDNLTVISYREKEQTKHSISFHLGEKDVDTIEPLGKKEKQHGCVISFKPSKKYLGNNTHIPHEDVIKWLETMTYLIDEKSKIKIKVTVYDGMDIKDKYTFKTQPFSLLLNKMVQNTSYSSLFTISGDGDIVEKIRPMEVKNGELIVSDKLKDVKKNVHLDVAVRYVPEQITLYDSYCNYTNTTDGGVHMDTVERCFCNYMQNKTKSMLTETQKEKISILWDDVRAGLCCVINLSTGAQVGFVGNAKTKIGNEELIPIITGIMNRCLDEFFSKNPSILKEFTNIVKLNAKARIESEKVKLSVKSERMDIYKENEMKNYIAPTSRNKNDELELFIVEGKSAGGGARNGSNPRIQGFLMIRGNFINPLKATPAEVMANQEVKSLVIALGCGISKTFNIKKLKYKRIYLMTDADSDGWGISSGLLVFFYIYYRELIEAGCLYKVFTPLYRIDSKEKEFLENKKELIDINYKSVRKHYKVKGVLDDSDFTKDDLYGFLEDVSDYQNNLIMVSDDMGHIYKYLVEAIIGYFTLLGGIDDEYHLKADVVKSNKFVAEFLSRIQVKYPEIKLEGDTVLGIANNRRYRIKLSDRRLKKCAPLIDIYRKYGYTLLVKENDKERKEMTIGEYLDDASKYFPRIISRYKGLGELNGNQLWETTLNIENRVSVQYTIEDVEKELGIFRILHGSSKKDAAARKQMMKDYKINREDLDN